MNCKGRISLIASLAIIALTVSSFVQVDKPTDRKDVIVASWERAKAYTKEYLEAASEEVYGFKPTPEMRSFGEQMDHLAVDNYKIVNAALENVVAVGKFRDLEKETLTTKAEITRAVLDSYDYAIMMIKGLDETKLGKTVKMYGRWETTVEDGLCKAFEHQTHHRGQAAVYLRLKGITPPREKLF